MSTVTQSWSQIVTWLEQNAPATAALINPPADPKTIRWLETAIGYSLPPDLSEYLRQADGTRHRWVQGRLVPTLYNLVPCEDMLDIHKMWIKISGRGPHLGDADPAGTLSTEWLGAFLPIGESGTSVKLFVDLRPGDLHGCVGEYSPEDGGFHSVPWWPSVGVMLEDLAEAMVNRRPACQEYATATTTAWSKPRPYLPTVEEDGYLRWDRVYED
ncbi:cell wall assembly regulator SMI1 [Kribbella amoyensis]|uniref:Cell wall assembly regulator SMI1 n=1 Tax=Kribbella amoyensis TaxID=996641 RepID=A0A561BLH3_9ACTN|nr:SMI1/KNR4 family protein [Kribbella amoyensis]TWD79642.1 cell wall assembly regulator SMI1 [Kribbella amoyensis]